MSLKLLICLKTRMHYASLENEIIINLLKSQMQALKSLLLLILSYLIYERSRPGRFCLWPPLSSLPVLEFGERIKYVFLYQKNGA